LNRETFDSGSRNQRDNQSDLQTNPRASAVKTPFAPRAALRIGLDEPGDRIERSRLAGSRRRRGAHWHGGRSVGALAAVPLVGSGPVGPRRNARAADCCAVADGAARRVKCPPNQVNAIVRAPRNVCVIK
jgi:hypothetical protein